MFVFFSQHTKVVIDRHKEVKSIQLRYNGPPEAIDEIKFLGVSKHVNRTTPAPGRVVLY